MNELQTIFTDYLNEVSTLIRNRKLGEGILGTRGGPGDDPCHERFFTEVGAWIEALAAEQPESGVASTAVSFLLTDEQLDGITDVARWMLIAVQKHCLPLLPYITPEQASALLTGYEAAYPRRKRFPAQNEVFKALKRRAG